MGAMASNHQPSDYLLNRFFKAQMEENIKAPRHWPLGGNSPVTGEFPAQKASNAENVSIWLCHHVSSCACDPAIDWPMNLTVLPNIKHRSICLYRYCSNDENGLRIVHSLISKCWFYLKFRKLNRNEQKQQNKAKHNKKQKQTKNGIWSKTPLFGKFQLCQHNSTYKCLFENIETATWIMHKTVLI